MRKGEAALTAANADPAPSKRSMLRILGVTFGIAVTLGNTIGSGIMRTPSQIANRLPSVPLIMLAWALGAVYSLLGAWSLAELGAMIPSSGAYYTVARRAFGDYAGFMVGWTDWIGQCGSGAAAAILAGEYGRDLLPSLSRPILTATVIAAALALMQWRGIRWGSRFQNVTSAITRGWLTPRSQRSLRDCRSYSPMFSRFRQSFFLPITSRTCRRADSTAGQKARRWFACERHSCSVLTRVQRARRPRLPGTPSVRQLLTIGHRSCWIQTSQPPPSFVP